MRNPSPGRRPRRPAIDKPIPIRLTIAERVRLHAAAANLEQPVATFCREALLRATAWSLNRPRRTGTDD